MEEDPDEEEHSPPPLVNHPVIPLLSHCLWNVGGDLDGASGGVRPLETLKTPSLRLVSLEMTGIAVESHVGVLVDCGHPAIREVHTRRAIVVRHCWR